MPHPSSLGQSSETLPILQMTEVCKSFPGVRALDNAALTVYPGEVHALMGENGAGKSTLLKILAGAQTADAGEIRLQGVPVTLGTPQAAMRLGIGIIYQELMLVPHLSVAENIFLGREPRLFPGWIDRLTLYRQAQAMMDELGLTVDARSLVGGLPLAQRQMVEIAKAASRRSVVMAMDEPSATLTSHELERLFALIARLKAKGLGIIYISHRMEEVFRIGDRVTVLRDGKTVGTHRMGETSREDLVREMVGRPLDETFPKISVAPGPPVLQVRNLTRGNAVRNVSFTVHAGEIVALAGLVGAGRTETARCLFGADAFSSGTIVFNSQPFRPCSPRDAIRAGMGFVTEDRKEQGVILPLSVRENITLASLQKVSRAGFITARRETGAAQASAQRLRVRTPSVEQKVGSLSGGNQQKVVIAKWLETPLKLLIMDEPTRGIDVGAKQEIYRIMNELTAQGVAILMISSELPEVLGMADRILVMREGRLAGELSRADATAEKVGLLALAN